MNIYNIHSAVLRPLYFNTKRKVEHFLQCSVLSMSNKFQNECNFVLLPVLSDKILSLSGLDQLTIVSCGYMIIFGVYIAYIIASIWKINDNFRFYLPLWEYLQCESCHKVHMLLQSFNCIKRNMSVFMLSSVSLSSYLPIYPTKFRYKNL